jgi:hypothetical protein
MLTEGECMIVFSDLSDSIKNKFDAVKISCDLAINSMQKNIISLSISIKDKAVYAANLSVSGIKCAVGYGIVGPVAGVVGFFGATEAIVMASALTYGAITGMTLANLLPFTLLVGSSFGILSTLSLMQLNTHRFTLWQALSKSIVGFVSNIFGINLNEMINSNSAVFVPAIIAASNYVKDTIRTTTPFSRALTWGMTAANSVIPECYSKDTIDVAARFGNYGL